MSRKQLKSFVNLMVKINIKLLPFGSLLYAVTVIIFIIYLNLKISPIFIFLCVEMFLNWYCVYRISCKSSPIVGREKEKLKTIVIKPKGDSTTYKYWYCGKCQEYVCKPVKHCFYCEKCYHFKDNHCFLLGVCLLRQNMGNLILLCFYASLASVYSMYIIGWHIYQHLDQIMNNNTDHFNLFENFCFPIAFIRLLSNNVMCIFLFLIFSIQVTVLFFCTGFAFWKLYACLNGKQHYADLTGKQNLEDIFGSYSLMNILFPYNGLIGKRNVNDYRYQLKEV